MTDKKQDNQEQDKMINREGCEIADDMFEITQQCCDREDWYPAMCHCAESLGTSTFFADIMLKITQLCETAEECHRAMRHCMEIFYARNYISLGVEEVVVLLYKECIFTTFEVAVNENEENRMSLLMEQIKAKLKSYNTINAIIFNFYKTIGCDFKLEEFGVFSPLLDSLPENCDVWWGLSPDKQCTEAILRATVLVMHEPQRVKSNKNNQLKERKESWTKKMYRKLLAAIPWKGIRCLKRLQGILLQTAM